MSTSPEVNQRRLGRVNALRPTTTTVLVLDTQQWGILGNAAAWSSWPESSMTTRSLVLYGFDRLCCDPVTRKLLGGATYVSQPDRT